MVCMVCGHETGPDRETGYNADGICPDCQAKGWDVDHAGNVIGPWPKPKVCRTHGTAMIGGICGLCEADASGSDLPEDLECPF